VISIDHFKDWSLNSLQVAHGNSFKDEMNLLTE